MGEFINIVEVCVNNLITVVLKVFIGSISLKFSSELLSLQILVRLIDGNHRLLFFLFRKVHYILLYLYYIGGYIKYVLYLSNR